MIVDDEDDGTDDWAEDDRATLTDPLPRKYREYDQSHSRKAGELRTIPWDPCPACVENAFLRGYAPTSIGVVNYDCPECLGVGYLNVPLDADSFRKHKPGSDARVIMLAARNAHSINPTMPDCVYRAPIDQAAVYLNPDPITQRPSC